MNPTTAVDLAHRFVDALTDLAHIREDDPLYPHHLAELDRIDRRLRAMDHQQLREVVAELGPAITSLARGG